MIQLIVDTAYDINAHLIGEAGKPLPDDYHTSFSKLAGIRVLPHKFSLHIAGSAGMRNRLVHECETIDLERVFKNLSFLIKNYKQEVYRFG